MNLAVWNVTLLLAALLSVIGGMTCVAALPSRERLLSVGMILQAVVLILVADGTVHARSDLPLAAVVVMSLFVLWSWLVLPPAQCDNPMNTEREVADASSFAETTSSLKPLPTERASNREAAP